MLNSKTLDNMNRSVEIIRQLGVGYYEDFIMKGDEEIEVVFTDYGTLVPAPWDPAEAPKLRQLLITVHNMILGYCD